MASKALKLQVMSTENNPVKCPANNHSSVSKTCLSLLVTSGRCVVAHFCARAYYQLTDNSEHVFNRLSYCRESCDHDW